MECLSVKKAYNKNSQMSTEISEKNNEKDEKQRKNEIIRKKERL